MAKNYKNKPRREVPLPEDFTWENLNEGIFEKIEVEKGKNKTRKPFFFGLNWQSLVVAALVVFNLLIVAYHLNYRGRVEETKLKQERIINQQQEQINAVDVGMSSSALVEENMQGENSSINEINLHEGDLQNVLSPKEELPINNESSIFKSTAPNIDKQTKIDEPQKSEAETELPESQIIAIDSGKDVLEPSLSTPAKSNFVALGALERGLPTSVLANENLESPNYSLLSMPSPKGKKFSIAVGGGLNYWQTSHFKQFTESTEFEVTEKALPNWNVSLELTYKLNEKLALRTGANYQELVSRFNYERVRVRKQEVNALVRVDINSFSADSTFVYQDTLVNSTELRKVQHYNKHRLLNIPLSMVYYMPLNEKYRFRTSLGAFLSVKSDSEGRTLLREDITDYCYCDTDGVFKNNYGFGLIVGIGIERKLKNDAYLSFSAQHSRWLQDWSQEMDMEYKASVTNVNFAIGKHF